MELWLQFGHGMIAMCRELHDEWGDASVILSPRDLSPTQLSRVAQELTEANACVFIDPQFYLPEANHERLVSHDYWPRNYNTAEFWAGEQLEALLGGLANMSEGCEGLIVPGLFARRIDDGWIRTINRVFDTRAFAGMDGRLRYATVALSRDVVNSEDQIHDLLDEIQGWPAEGIYLVVEHPANQYLVQEPNWLMNILDLIAGARLAGKKVVVGYTNHQMLIASCAGANAIAAGTWLNTRSGFDPSRYIVGEDQIAQRATWYYSPQALSEYKVTYLDIARRTGVLNTMAPPTGYDARSCAVLFGGAQPTQSGFGEPDAFRHYLRTLRKQSIDATADTFEATATRHLEYLTAVDALRQTLSASGVLGQLREFSQACTDAQRAALGALQATRGALLKRSWKGLSNQPA